MRFYKEDEYQIGSIFNLNIDLPLWITCYSNKADNFSGRNVTLAGDLGHQSFPDYNLMRCLLELRKAYLVWDKLILLQNCIIKCYLVSIRWAYIFKYTQLSYNWTNIQTFSRGYKIWTVFLLRELSFSIQFN